jgi:hypothetical protein
MSGLLFLIITQVIFNALVLVLFVLNIKMWNLQRQLNDILRTWLMFYKEIL